MYCLLIRTGIIWHHTTSSNVHKIQAYNDGFRGLHNMSQSTTTALWQYWHILIIIRKLPSQKCSTLQQCSQIIHVIIHIYKRILNQISQPKTCFKWTERSIMQTQQWQRNQEVYHDYWTYFTWIWTEQQNTIQNVKSATQRQISVDGTSTTVGRQAHWPKRLVCV